MTKRESNMLILVFVALALSVLFAAIVSDTAWCVENWGWHEEVISCLHYENSIYGKFIQP